MVALFETFLFIAFAVFLLFDTVFCTCQLTPQFKVPDEKNRISFERDARNLFKQYWPEWFDESKYNRDEINQKMDELGQTFYKRKSQGFYTDEEEFDYKAVKEELMKGRESHNFAGIVVCRDGSMIHESKARLELLDYNLRVHSRQCHSLHDKAKYHRKSASFDFPAFIGKNDISLVKFRFYDVCFDGQEIEVNAYVDGIGHFVL